MIFSGLEFPEKGHKEIKIDMLNFTLFLYDIFYIDAYIHFSVQIKIKLIKYIDEKIEIAQINITNMETKINHAIDFHLLYVTYGDYLILPFFSMILT